MSTKETVKKLDQRLQILESLKKRLVAEAKPDPNDPLLGHVSDMADTYPLLHTVMHAHLLEGGPDRGGTILLWGSEDGLGGVFSIASLGVKMFFVADSLQDAMYQLEKALGDPDHKWKKERPKKASRNPYGKSTGRTS